MILRMKLWLTSPAHKWLAAKKTISIIFFSEKFIINSLEISCYNWGDLFPDKWFSAEIHFQETIKHRAETRDIIWEDIFQSAFASVLRDKKVERQVNFQSGKATSPVHKGRGAAALFHGRRRRWKISTLACFRQPQVFVFSLLNDC